VEHCAPAGIHGIDPSAAQIAYARSRASTAMASFDIGDAVALPFPDGQFDATVMALVLFFLPDPARGVAELRRVTREGGLVCAYLWDVPGGGAPPQPFFAEFEARGIMPMRPVRSDVSTIAAMAALWHEAGLAAVQTHTIAAERQFPNFETYWAINAAGSTVAPTLAHMSDDEREDVKRALQSKLPTDHSGQITVRAYINAVRGTVPAR